MITTEYQVKGWTLTLNDNYVWDLSAREPLTTQHSSNYWKVRNSAPLWCRMHLHDAIVMIANHEFTPFSWNESAMACILMSDPDPVLVNMFKDGKILNMVYLPIKHGTQCVSSLSMDHI